MDNRRLIFPPDWLITDYELFRALGLPGMLYAADRDERTNQRYFIALEYDERPEPYYDGYDWKRRTARYKKYILYRITHKVGRLSGNRDGEFKSFDDARDAAERACPGGDFTASGYAAQQDRENDLQLARGYLSYMGMPLEEYKAVERLKPLRSGENNASGCALTVLAFVVTFFVTLVILVIDALCG